MLPDNSVTFSTLHAEETSPTTRDAESRSYEVLVMKLWGIGREEESVPNAAVFEG